MEEPTTEPEVKTPKKRDTSHYKDWEKLLPQYRLDVALLKHEAELNYRDLAQKARENTPPINIHACTLGSYANGKGMGPMFPIVAAFVAELAEGWRPPRRPQQVPLPLDPTNEDAVARRLAMINTLPSASELANKLNESRLQAAVADYDSAQKQIAKAAENHKSSMEFSGLLSSTVEALRRIGYIINEIPSGYRVRWA